MARMRAECYSDPWYRMWLFGFEQIYDQYEMYCVGKVRKTNSRGFVTLSCVVAVIFHRVAYCVVIFNLLVGTKVVAFRPPIGRIA
jgi:hypothetical protein